MAGRFPWLKRASPDDEVADADPSDGWQRHIQTLKEAGIPEPGVAVQGNRPATQADEEALYGVAPSFVELLPWVEYLPVSALLLMGGHHHHGHDHGHDHDHAHHHGHDNNLRSAYFHVLADALTSLLAIGALLAGRYLGLHWMDPAMGLVGALVIARWSWGLMRDTAALLLDTHVDEAAAATQIGRAHVCTTVPTAHFV